MPQQLHKHSPEQQALLQQLLVQFAGELVAFNFSNPEHDAQMIRAHAYKRGQYDIVQQLLADSYPDPSEQVEDPKPLESPLPSEDLQTF